MMKQALFLIAVAGLFTKLYLHALTTATVAPVHVNVDAATEQEILRSTIQIAMFEYAPEAGGAEPGSRGLGTLVSYAGQTLIVTHDHWAHLTPSLHEVELHDSAGRLLLTLDAQIFRALIAYRDGGTMVLRTPAGLQGLVPATLGAPAGQGDVVWFARRDPAAGRTTVEVVAATVTSLHAKAKPASMHLRNVDGSAVIPGDSGGGVWADGKLAANMWAAGVKEQRFFWSDWFGGRREEASNLAIAALQPLGSQADAVAQSQTDADATGLDPDPHAEDVMPTKEDQLQATLLAD